MKFHASRHHRLVAALIALVALLTLSEAGGRTLPSGGQVAAAPHAGR